MAKLKQTLYNDLQRLVKDKDTAVTNYIAGIYNRLQAMFVYSGATETLNTQALEFALQSKGHCIVAKVDGDLYALQGEPTGELNAYFEPTQYIVANPWLKLNKTFDIGKDCVLFRNDFLMQGLQPVIGSHAVKLTDTEISLNTAAVLSRITMLISAQDDKTKASADLFLQKILNGDFSVIGENQFFDGVRLQTLPASNQQSITPLVELLQYYRASLWHELGLQANYNMKRERLTEGETQANVDSLLPLADAMLTERKKAVEQVNEMFGLQMTVEFGSSWHTLHEEEEKANEMTETDSETHEAPAEGVGDVVETDTPAGDTTDTSAAGDEVDASDGRTDGQDEAADTSADTKSGEDVDNMDVDETDENKTKQQKQL